VDVAVPYPDGGCTLTAQQPLNNLIRTTMQAMAAVLGGASLWRSARMTKRSFATEESVRLSLRTQQIIAHESGSRIRWILGGSYYVESLTAKSKTGRRVHC